MKRLPASIGILILIALAITAGCAKPPAGEIDQKARGRQAQTPAAEMMVIPAGTNVVTSLETRLTTGTNHTGDQFVATTTEPIVVDGRTAVPAGARINGVLSNVQGSGRVKGRAHMTLAFQQIVGSEGKVHAISAHPITLQADSGTGGDAAKIAAGGIIGAVIGGISGGGKDAAIGTAVGAGAGTVLVLATKGDEIELDPGQKLNVHMTSPTSIPVVAQR